MEEKRVSKKKKQAKQATTPAVNKTTHDSFQNPLARTGVFMPNLLEATDYPLTRFSRDWQTINSLYRSHWVVRRIIDVIPEDMTKNGYKITSQIEPDAIKKLETNMRRTSTHKNILKGLKWGRLYGGAGALIMIEGQEDQLDQPLDMDQVMPGSYKGLLVLDRWSGITPNDKLIEDPSDPEFGLPESYTLTSEVLEKGIQVHHSRILRFTGRPLPYLEEIAEQYWGASEIEHVIDELKKRDNVSWNIATLTFMASLRVMKLEGMGMVLATGNEKAQADLYNTIQNMNALMNNNSIQILGENDSYESHQYTFGGIAQVYDCFMMDVAGAAETPVTKLFGRAPAGMNATGESDMQNYYDTIEEKQENELRPVYDKLLPIIMMSTFGAVPDDFDYEFNPVRRAPEEEMADLASKNTDSVTKAFQAGLISQRVALKELRQQSELTGMWTNITDDDIEKADDEVMNPDEGMGGMMGGFGGEEPPGDPGEGEKDQDKEMDQEKPKTPPERNDEAREA
jgi:phage-related protein (TIGR01555 family)